MKRWHLLLFGGLAGVASLLLAPFEQLVPSAVSPISVRAAVIVQPALLTVAAVAIGQALAERFGLGTPLLDAILHDGRSGAILRRQVSAAIPIGLTAAALLVAYATLIVPLVAEPGVAARLSRFAVPLPARVLYGGITEEILTRWGLVSLFVWAISGFQKVGPVAARTYWAAIVLAAILFALGHVPLLMDLSHQPSFPLVLAVLIANAVPGVMFGWLFWRRGLEAAIMAHAVAHIASAPFQV